MWSPENKTCLNLLFYVWLLVTFQTFKTQTSKFLQLEYCRTLNTNTFRLLLVTVFDETFQSDSSLVTTGGQTRRVNLQNTSSWCDQFSSYKIMQRPGDMRSSFYLLSCNSSISFKVKHDKHFRTWTCVNLQRRRTTLKTPTWTLSNIFELKLWSWKRQRQLKCQNAKWDH